MAPEIQVVVHATQAWLQSSWHIQVPFAWLEACVEWLQEEAGGAGRLSQQQINQQQVDRDTVFLYKRHESIPAKCQLYQLVVASCVVGALDQWLLTDLRDLDHPVLPEGLCQAQKTELRGTYCVQVDSLLDVSQPAYGQLQKLRGTNCANDEVSAVTQATQRPWEAKPTRMLLLQVTDGVQSLEAMEYQSIPVLSEALRPGVKLQLRGQMVCRLGVLLLGPSNIKVLGGEVEDLVDRNNQGRVLCRALGLPEEEQQQQQEEEAPPAPQQGHQVVEELGLDDAELLASLEAQEEVERFQDRPVRDSGYGTATQSSRSSSIRSHVSAVSSRSEASARSHRSGLTHSNTGGLFQDHRHGNEQELSDFFDPLASDHLIEQEIPDRNTADVDFPDEDFDDLPLDEMDADIFQETTNVTDSSHRGRPQTHNRITGNPNSAALEPLRELEFVTNDESDFMDEDMDCLFTDMQTERTGGPNQPPAQQGPSRDRESATNKADTSGSSCRLTSDSSKSVTPQGQRFTSSGAEFDRASAKKNPQSDCSVSALTLTSPPFTYLCLLEEMMSKPHAHTTEILVKAFIVTLLGKLSSNTGVWRICATISDGTSYLDVELSDEVLTGLLGFSVAEKGALKRDPTRRGELDAGMRRCQEELVDMCCIMTIVIEAEGRKAVVTKAEPVNAKVFQELEQRVRDRKK